MPHYVIAEDDGYYLFSPESPDAKFFIYSTIVDAPITASMSAPEMRDYLATEGYESWIGPAGPKPEFTTPNWAEGEPGLDKYARATHNRLDWHPTQGFYYGSLAEPYFCLPRSSWRRG